MDFHCYFIEFKRDFQSISIGISLIFPFVYHLEFQLDLQLTPLDFHLNFIEISACYSFKFQLDFQWISIVVSFKFKHVFIEMKTGIQLVF